MAKDLGFKSVLTPATTAAEAPLSKADKFKRIVSLSKSLNEKHETTNSLVCLGDKKGTLLPSIATGLYTFDYQVIQTGGVPKGRIIEFFGPESAGKTSATLHVIAECQAA